MVLTLENIGMCNWFIFFVTFGTYWCDCKLTIFTYCFSCDDFDRSEQQRRNQSWQFAGQVQTLTGQWSKQKTTIDALKQELEKSLQCYEECRAELKDMVTQYDAQEIQIQALNNLVTELKKVKGELEDTLEKNEAICHQWGAHLASAYRRVLERFGAEAQEFKITDNIRSYCQWMNSELKLLPDTISKAGDYGVATCSQTIFQLLEKQGCEHFKAFDARGFEFPPPDDMPAPSKTAKLITKIVLRNFLVKSDREHARKKALERLTKVTSLILVSIILAHFPF
jgi:chaperonin cofactor prefoldin